MFNFIVPVVVGVAVLALLFGLFKVRRLSLQSLILALAGALAGGLLGALLSVPVGKLPAPYGDILPVLVTIAMILVLSNVFIQQREVIMHWFPFFHPKGEQPAASEVGSILVDTSVIIDGRIADIAKAGFIPGRLLVPRFVLAELQNIADSEDALRRGRGRRGLEVLNTLRTDKDVQVEIIEEDPKDVPEVDAKLVRLAKKLGTNILTTDYNLNRVAQIEGVRVLNINELSNAIRPVVLPGEEITTKVVQAGKERGQGVGYLADGTMIVVEQGDKLIGQDVVVEVTRVFQTVAGKMIFGTPKGAGGTNGKAKHQRKSQRNKGSSV